MSGSPGSVRTRRRYARRRGAQCREGYSGMMPAVRTVFDKAYYDRFYRNPDTRAVTPAAVRRQAQFIAAYLSHLEVPVRCLERRSTYNAEESENRIIHGDNLEALKALEKLYEKTGQMEEYLDVLEQQLDIVVALG